MQYVETPEDMTNAQAWAELLEDAMHVIPEEIRTEVLKRTLAMWEKRVAKYAEAGTCRWMTATQLLEDVDTTHSQTSLRLKGLMIQVLARDVTIGNSAKDAAKILFSEHPCGRGSRLLGDYIDDLPRKGLP